MDDKKIKILMNDKPDKFYYSNGVEPDLSKMKITRDTKIYFAGKIGKGDWRHKIISNLRCFDYWGIYNEDEKGKLPKLPNFTYAGPFFVSDDHGCGHGCNSHGCGNEETTCFDAVPRTEVVKGCLNQINEADIIFCWLDNLDAYGTLFELGYAYSKNKRIFLAIDEKIKSTCDDFWFIKEASTLNWYSTYNYYNNIEIAWEDFIRPITNEDKTTFYKSLSELKDLEREDYISMLKREPMSKVIRFFKRNQEIVKILKELYNSQCQVKGCQFTFEKENGENYCETHHLQTLENNGDDEIKNMVCVCPNHHKILHYGAEIEKNKLIFDYKKEHYDLLKPIQKSA